jgi:serine/threonine protein kinase/Tol biopolymer transport system component
LIGSRISHFRIVSRLGGEGAGVYRAEDLAAGFPVLMFLLSPERGGSAAVERFRRAALGASALSHPNIAPVKEIGETEDGSLYVSMPAAEGETLESFLARGGLSPRDAVDLAAQIAAGLARAHSAGFVHGDLRPSCVLVTSYGEVKVAAFGLGELAAPGVPKAPDEGLGLYRAPEILRGAAPAPASDVWSLGVILCEMIAGRHPFPGEDDRARIAAVLDGAEPEPLPVPRGGLPRGLDGIRSRALAWRPEDRYPDAGPLETALLHCFASIEAPSGLADTRVEIPVAGGQSAPAGGSAAGPTPHGIAGRKLPSYRIFERLGSGAMSVVYRAEDTRLERMVALKFLAPELSRDPQAKARFLGEARAASSLDHPNLCTIHEIGETDDGQIFLAMPYYGGETLAQRIARGPLPVEEALGIALQVAQGLAKAHRHGILHRDVKPANLMLTPDGVVKIVDFGLAKLADASGPRTESGGGTLAYVSPEQAQGELVDRRTDLWSLGVVLYEMVTGRKPFTGDTEQAVLYAILRDPPRPLEELRPEVPPELLRITRRLLARDREERYDSAESVAADLRALRGPESLGSLSMSMPPRQRSPRWRRLAWLAAAVLFLAAAVLVWVLRGREVRETAPVTLSYSAVADLPGRMLFPSLAPDAQSLVFTVEKDGSSDVYWQRVGGGNAIDLTGDFSGIDTQPAISPNGEQVVFRSEREGGGLFTMGATGESVRRISDFGYNPSWSPDGREVVCATETVSSPGERGKVSELWRIDVATGERRRVPTGDAVQPSWSPHNRRIAYWGIPIGTSRRVIWTVSVNGVDGGAAVPVVDGALNWSPVWSPDGEYLYFASNRSGAMGLWRVPIDESSGRPLGEPQAVTVPAPSSAMPSLSRDGRHIAFALWSPKSNLFRVPFDPARREPAGPLQAVIEGSKVVRSADMSPDGRWIVFDTSEPQEDLYLVRPDGGGMRALTGDPALDRGPRWSPDGRRILFFSDRDGKYDAYTIAPTGPALERLTAVPGEAVLDPLWSPDGRSLVYLRRASGLALLDLTPPLAERRPRPLPVLGQPAAAFSVTSWSADGNWLAGYDDRLRIILYSFPARRYEVLSEEGQEVSWLRDGATLLFLRGGALWSLDRPSGATRELLAPPRGLSFTRLSVAPGDRALVLVVEPSEGAIGLITLK